MIKHRDDRMTLLVNEQERIKIMDEVRDRKTTISELIRDALAFYFLFDSKFLAQVDISAEKIKKNAMKKLLED